jgi:tetratricopeptide (TPR) repeat protein
MEVGKNREEFRVRKVARLISVGANELYNKALKQYYKNDFWGAYFTFMRLQTEFPDFFKNDMASYYAGSCLEELDMREEALKILKESKELYPLSSATPLTDLAMMRIYYRQGSYDDVSSQFAELQRMSVSDSIRMHGCYIMGEADLQRKEYKRAIQYFDLVNDGHPVYVFAQHSAAVAWFNLENQEMAVTSLENCLSAKGTTPSQIEIVNRSMVFLGLIFYEDDALSKAVSVLNMVPSGSYYKEDALLGSAWTALKARQWKDVINYGQQLAQLSPKFVNQCEGALLQAYGNMMEKKYDQAKLLLEPVVEKLKSFAPLTEDSLNSERVKYDSDRISYSFLAENVTDAAKKGSSVKSNVVDSLHNIQTATKDKIDKFYLFTDESGRRMFFERSLSKVQEDIEYAIATITKMTNRVGTEHKVIDKLKDTDEEIQKLRDQMEKMGAEEGNQQGTEEINPQGTEEGNPQGN